MGKVGLGDKIRILGGIFPRLIKRGKVSGARWDHDDSKGILAKQFLATVFPVLPPAQQESELEVRDEVTYRK